MIVAVGELKIGKLLLPVCLHMHSEHGYDPTFYFLLPQGDK